MTSTGTGLRPLPPRRSWPASTPRCSGLSASASTTPSSILVETAFCRCRSWRGRVLRACCCGHATYSSSRPWPAGRGRPGRRQRRWRCRRGHRATAATRSCAGCRASRRRVAVQPDGAAAGAGRATEADVAVLLQALLDRHAMLRARVDDDGAGSWLVTVPDAGSVEPAPA
ncbi:linear gramicidin synthetase subunit D domain protein [Mycobacterium xenopi 4042]|uniref:Linear gramicidin synthetase subunit D domain protein n=1 Tax=Mycobacterium xenopi 4042 TaxID=1299334 RepID=X7ZES3_MYCXE|nr:linear gramicidin synthetase subunit D domain protein [Mycobacterium xenopi 4042]